MGDLVLTGMLNLSGTLELKPSGKLKIGSLEALVEAAEGNGAPVPLPPPAPVDTGTKVTVKKSFNATIKVNGKALVTQGVTMQGNTPTWPGMVQASIGNPTVTANHIPINVVNDLAMTLPTGAPTPLTTSGQ
jgi:hypothetical protein